MTAMRKSSEPCIAATSSQSSRAFWPAWEPSYASRIFLYMGGPPPLGAIIPLYARLASPRRGSAIAGGFRRGAGSIAGDAALRRARDLDGDALDFHPAVRLQALDEGR